jgi:hypothetical protein
MSTLGSSTSASVGWEADEILCTADVSPDGTIRNLGGLDRRWPLTGRLVDRRPFHPVQLWRTEVEDLGALVEGAPALWTPPPDRSGHDSAIPAAHWPHPPWRYSHYW